MIQFPASGKSFSKFLYWIAIGVIFGAAVWWRFSLPLDPIADQDTWGYLAPALHQLTGDGFVHEGRNFIYPTFLFVVLRLFGDFRAITIAQHLLGLAAGGLLLITWQRLRVFARLSQLNAGIHRALGVVLATVFLVAGEPIQAEMGIRPEGIAAFLLSLNLWLTVEFVARTFLEKRPLPVGFGVAVAISAVLLASVKPSFVFLVLVPLIPVGFSLLKPGVLSRKIYLAGSSVAGALLLLLPEYFLGRNDYLSQLFLPTNLFVVHADLIRDQMADDLKGDANLPYPREWLNRIQVRLSEEIAKSAAESEYYSSLGFSPDFLMYRQDSIAALLNEEFRYDSASLTAFYRFYYWRTWRHRPLAMAKKIGRQFMLFYTPLCPAYDRSKFLPLTPWYQIGAAALNDPRYGEIWKAYPPTIEFTRRTSMLAQTARPIQQSRVIRRTLDFLAGAYLPLLATALVLGSTTLFLPEYRRRLGLLALATLFVFSYNVAACFEVAILNSLEVPRYSTIQFVFTLFAEFLAIWLVVESLVPWIRWGRPIQTSTPGE